MSKLLEQLNETQRQAVLATEGPVMVIAGAGSGKTRVLTYKVAYLLEKGVDAFNILALTFTNKAANEMKERITKLVNNKDSRNVWMGTFHSIFSKILRIEADKLGYPSNFTIYDTDDSKNVIKTIIKEMNLDEKIYQPSLVQNRISAAKSNLISPKAYLNDVNIQNYDKTSGRPQIAAIYSAYNQRCFRASAMDFDDLLFNTNLLLQNYPEVLYKYQNKFKYILVDEYQDTNYAQYLIVKKLAADNENICIVGDDAQSIYSFRGANIQNILNFKNDYPDVKIFKLEQNYRSSQNIVNAANSVIYNNKNQIFKQIWTKNEVGEKITVIRATSEAEEGQLIAQSIFETKMNQQIEEDAFAVLYRTNAQSRAIEEALRKINIPYKIYGGISFYNRKEIKDLIAYFRLCINNKDEEALLRIINIPARGIGKTSLEKIIIIANNNNKSIWEILENINLYAKELNASIRSKIDEFVTMIKSFSVQVKTKNAYELARLITFSTGIYKELKEDTTPEGINRLENIDELLNGIKQFSETPRENELELSNDIRTLDEYLQEIALLTSVDVADQDNSKKVSLMTIHAAKGLEFPYVYIAGVEENLFPSQLSITSREDLEEERRLFYVAMTRAMRKLTISYAETRFKWGNLTFCEPSRFIEEIDEQYIAEETRYKNKTNFSTEKYNDYFELPSHKLKTKPTPKVPEKLIPLKKTENQSFNTKPIEYDPDIAKKIHVGMTVNHDRFGNGTVVAIEGTDGNTKATINFTAFGQKQLLLKFAKLKIIS